MKNKKFTNRILAGILTIGILFSFVGCSTSKIDEVKPTPTNTEAVQQNEILERTAFKLNTWVTIKLYDSTDESIMDEAMEICDKYEKLLSRTIETSEIYQLNQSQKSPVTVSDDTLEVITTGLKYCELSNGYFDITVEPLTSLWNFGSLSPQLPEETKIQEALSHIGYQKVQINGNKVSFTEENMGIDLGAIAKGYIADKIKEFLLSKGVNSAIISLGGNVLCIGSKPNGAPFTIGIQKPFETRNETVINITADDKSIVSSGIYERYIEIDGKQYHHILDPSTGYSYDNNLLSVSIISDKSVDGDALSTTCFSLGLDEGIELINSLDDIYAVFITKDGELHYSEGFFENITIIE